MLRPRLACVKHVTLAVFAIALLLGAVEVGLRVHHSWEVQSGGERMSFQSLSMPCWKCHHALKPLKSTVARNPDTQLPVSIRTNCFGLRGDAIAVPKPRDVFRILYLGDETVFASEVAEEDTFCQLISKELKRFPGQRWEVINAGVPGYCPLLSYLQFKHALASLEPDLLILNLDMSDVADDHHYRRHARIGPAGMPLVCSHPALQPNPNRTSFSKGPKLLLVEMLKRQLGLLPADEQRLRDRDEIDTPMGRYAWTREERADWQIYIAQALSPILDLKTLLDQLSCPFLVTISPAPWQVSERAMPDPEARQTWGIDPGKVYDPQLALASIVQYLEANSIAYCDLSGAFRDSSQPEILFHQTVPRLSRQGHILFARTVADSLNNSPRLQRRQPAFPSLSAGVE